MRAWTNTKKSRFGINQQRSLLFDLHVGCPACVAAVPRQAESTKPQPTSTVFNIKGEKNVKAGSFLYTVCPLRSVFLPKPFYCPLANRFWLAQWFFIFIFLFVLCWIFISVFFNDFKNLLGHFPDNISPEQMYVMQHGNSVSTGFSLGDDKVKTESMWRTSSHEKWQHRLVAVETRRSVYTCPWTQLKMPTAGQMQHVLAETTPFPFYSPPLPFPAAPLCAWTLWTSGQAHAYNWASSTLPLKYSLLVTFSSFVNFFLRFALAKRHSPTGCIPSKPPAPESRYLM